VVATRLVATPSIRADPTQNGSLDDRIINSKLVGIIEPEKVGSQKDHRIHGNHPVKTEVASLGYDALILQMDRTKGKARHDSIG
jgi:hypothetical protein